MNFKELLYYLNMSVEELARRLNLSKQAIYTWLQGRRCPTMLKGYELSIICKSKKLDVDLFSIFKLTTDNYKKNVKTKN